MKRFYLSKIFRDDDPPLNPWMHKLQKYPDREYIGGEIRIDPQTGAPVAKAVLVLVAGRHHAVLASDPDIIPIPDVPFDVKVASMHTPTKLATKAALRRIGFSATEVDQVWDNADGMRDVLNYYGRMNNPKFDVNDFDLTDY